MKIYDFKVQKVDMIEYLGGNDHGSYPYYSGINKGDYPVAICIGIGDDAEAELDLINKYGYEVYAYDPNVRTREYVKTIHNERFNYYPYAISDSDGPLVMYDTKNPQYVSWLSKPENVGWAEADSEEIICEAKTIKTILRELNIERIDFLKINAEGLVYDIINNILKDEIDVRQITISLPGRGMENTYDLDEKMNNALIGSGYKCIGESCNCHFTFIK